MDWPALATFALAGAILPYAAALLPATRRQRAAIDMSDPYEPDAESLAGAIKAVAAEMDARPRPVRLTIIAPDDNGRTFSIDLSRTGSRFIVSDSAEPEKIAEAYVRKRWICEHPVPYVIRPRTRNVLYITPVDANRFRVSCRPPRGKPAAWPLLAGAAGAAIALVADAPWLFAFCVGLSAGGGLAARLR